MTKEEFNNKREELENKYCELMTEFRKKAEEYLTPLDNLYNEYALSIKELYKVGDVFEDIRGKIKIEEITEHINFSGNGPSLRFYGAILKKDGTFEKRGRKRHCYLEHEVKK